MKKIGGGAVKILIYVIVIVIAIFILLLALIFIIPLAKDVWHDIFPKQNGQKAQN